MKTKLILSILFFLLSTNLHTRPYLDLEKPFDSDVSKLACIEGNTKECILLVLKYIKGTDELDKNDEKAKLYADKACKLGNYKGCMLFSYIDEKAEKKLLNQLCTDGNNTACKDLQVLKNKKYYVIDKKCSKCGSIHIGTYMYGYVIPDTKLQVKIDKGEIRLGGCMLPENPPEHFCLKCGVDLYEHNTTVGTKNELLKENQ